MEIIFCKQCGRRIKQDELQTNQFTLTEDKYFCVACMPITTVVPEPDAGQRRKSSAIIRPKTTAQSAVMRNKTGRVSAVDNRPPSSHSMPGYKAKPDKKPPVAIYASIGLAVLAVLIVVAVLALQGDPPKPPPPGPDNVVNQPPTPPPTGPTPPDVPTPLRPPIGPGPDSTTVGPDTPELIALLNEDIQRAIRDSQAGERAPWVCKSVPAPPTLDGQLNDPCWTGATTFADFTDDVTRQPAAATQETVTLRMVLSQGGLYIAGEALVPEGTANMKAEKTLRDQPLWEEESIEIFLLAPTAKRRYAQIIVNPKGAVEDLQGRIGEGRDNKVNFPGIQAATNIAPDRWTFELFIPVADLYGTPSGRWKFNFNRNRVPKTGSRKFMSRKAIGGDYHAWPQYDEIDFQGASADVTLSAQDRLRTELPDYQAFRRVYFALRNPGVPFDTLNVPPKPRAVTLPYCPTFTMQDAGAAFDAPLGAVSYFNTSMSLRPVAEVGLLRMGALTTGTTAHFRATVRMNGGDTNQPRLLGLVLKSAPGSATPTVGLTGVVVMDSQIAGLAASRIDGRPQGQIHYDQAPLVMQPLTAQPIDLDFCVEPGLVKTYANGRLVAQLPWPTDGKTAADVVGLYTQNSGCDIFKLLITTGLVAETRELLPYGHVITAPDLAEAATDLAAYPDASAALGLAVACLKPAYDAAHAGQALPATPDFNANPRAEFKLMPHGEMPYRVYARLRAAGSAAGGPLQYWLQIGNLKEPDNPDAAPGKAVGWLFERPAAPTPDWGWAPLIDATTRKPVTLVFKEEKETTLRLIAGTLDTAIDQIVFLPSAQPMPGREQADDTCFLGGRLPPTFAWAAPVGELTAAASVVASRYRVSDGPVGPLPPNGPDNPPPTPAGGTADSADGFITKATIGALKIIPARNGMPGFPDLAGSQLTLPPLLNTTHFFQAKLSDWKAAQGTALAFNLKSDAMVFLALDPSQTAAKSMLNELLADGFEASSLLVEQQSPAATYQVVRRRYGPGTVRFVGHNLAAAPPLLFVLPVDLTPRQPVDMTQPLPTIPGLPPDSFVVQLQADEVAGAVDLKKAVTATLHKVDVVPTTSVGSPAWAFYGIPASAGRGATGNDASYITLADAPAMNRARGAVSFWVYLGGTGLSKHAILARKVGNLSRQLEITRGIVTSNFGDRLCRAKNPIPSYKWTLVVWNFGPDGQQFIIDGQVEELQAIPVDLSAGGEFRVGNDYQKNCLEGFLAELSFHDRLIESATPKEGIPPALKLNMQMEKVADPGAIFIYGFDNTAPLPKEADLSGNGRDGAWDQYRGAVTTGQSAMIGAERDRVANLKHGAQGNPYLTVAADPVLDLTSGSIYMTVNLDKAALKKVTGDVNRCQLIDQINGARTNAIYFGDTMTNGFYFATLQTQTGTATTGTSKVKSPTDLEGGIWYRVALTWTPKKLRLYQNGILVDEKPNPGFKLDGKGKPLTFFGRENDATRGFVGLVGQLKLYSYARSQWE